MPSLRRRPRLPSEVRAALDLPPDDKVLASARAADGTWVVATRAAVHLAPADGSPERRPWTDVDNARLDGQTQVLSVNWVDGRRSALELPDEASRLAVVLRERVQNSLVHVEHVELPRGGSVRVALRRAADGTLSSQVIGSGTVDLSDPATAEVVDAAEARVRGAAGLTS